MIIRKEDIINEPFEPVIIPNVPTNYNNMNGPSFHSSIYEDTIQASQDNIQLRVLDPHLSQAPQFTGTMPDHKRPTPLRVPNVQQF